MLGIASNISLPTLRPPGDLTTLREIPFFWFPPNARAALKSVIWIIFCYTKSLRCLPYMIRVTVNRFLIQKWRLNHEVDTLYSRHHWGHVFPEWLQWALL
jgi:hypothetical protein